MIDLEQRQPHESAQGSTTRGQPTGDDELRAAEQFHRKRVLGGGDPVQVGEMLPSWDPLKRYRSLASDETAELFAELEQHARYCGFNVSGGEAEAPGIPPDFPRLRQHPGWEQLHRLREDQQRSAQRKSAERQKQLRTNLLLMQFGGDGREHERLQSDGFEAFTLHGSDQEQTRQRQAMDAIRRETDRTQPRNVMLFGPSGTGKDLLMKLLALSVFSREDATVPQVTYLRGMEFFGRVRDSIKDSGSEGQLLAEYAAPDILCLSDPLPPFGQLSEFQGQMLYRLVERRIGKATWVTINISGAKEGRERMGVQSFDRLCAGALVVCCRWPSWRQPAEMINCGKASHE